MTTEDRIADLERRLGKVEDLLAIRNLQHAYGYYLDKCLYDEVVDLFAEDGQVIFIGGIYKGRAGTPGSTPAVPHQLRQREERPFVRPPAGPPDPAGRHHGRPTVATAKARFRVLMQAGTHQLAATPQAPVRQWFEGGLYENATPAPAACGRSARCSTGRSGTVRSRRAGRTRDRTSCPTRAWSTRMTPTAPTSCLRTPRRWLDTTTLAFHYRHPVTGKEFVPDSWGAFPTA